MSTEQEVTADYQMGGMSLRSHPLRFLREDLQRRNIITAAEMLTVEADRRYRIAGLVLLRQRPSTAKGITFMTLEDETGTANLLVHQSTWERFYRVARTAGALIARGTLQRQDEVTLLIVDQLESLKERLAAVPNRSRDFR